MNRQPGRVPAIMGRTADLKVGTTAAPSMVVQNLHITRIAASGARLGRIRMAADAASPAISAEREDEPSVKYIAPAQNAAAGTSLIGDTSMASTAGLVATSHAAASPTAS